MDWRKLVGKSREFFGGYDPDVAWGHSLSKDLPGMYKEMPQDEAERYASNYLAAKNGRYWQAVIGNAFNAPDFFDVSPAAQRRTAAGIRGREAGDKERTRR